MFNALGHPKGNPEFDRRAGSLSNGKKNQAQQRFVVTVKSIFIAADVLNWKKKPIMVNGGFQAAAIRFRLIQLYEIRNTPRAEFIALHGG